MPGGGQNLHSCSAHPSFLQSSCTPSNGYGDRVGTQWLSLLPRSSSGFWFGKDLTTHGWDWEPALGFMKTLLQGGIQCVQLETGGDFWSLQ